MIYSMIGMYKENLFHNKNTKKLFDCRLSTYISVCAVTDV